MKIGVVCEGPTDYPAIAHFFGNALSLKNINAEFRPLFPDMDMTRPIGGWANVLSWLRNNPPHSRIQRYFGGGLFGGSLAVERLDAILIHLDADILSNDSFKNFVNREFDFNVIDVDDPVGKGTQIAEIINIAGCMDHLTNADRAKHVPAPAVESTETWCVAAFTMPPKVFEVLKGADLTNAFMTALEISEGRQPRNVYQNIDKSVARREQFCTTHASQSARIILSCQHFSNAIERLVALTT